MSRALALRPAREAAAVGLVAAVLSAAVLWLGPPGVDLPAHLYQRQLFLEHGFLVWNNFWYAGRYSFVTYSLLYYPLVAVSGIAAVAVASVGAAAFGFALLALREWGAKGRGSAWAFAILWPGTLLSATFPFLLGFALALLALCALQGHRRAWFAVLALLSLAASPLAFALLGVVLAGAGLVRWGDRPTALVPFLVIAGGVAAELVVFRIFPGGGSYPFRLWDFARAMTFAGLGVLATRRLANARVLAGFFVAYGLVCTLVFLVPGQVGSNLTRVEYAAVPVAFLVLALRGWRPLWLVLPLAGLAAFWNFGALAGSFERSSLDQAHAPELWAPATAFLHHHLSPDYRVEAVDTVGHWPAVYLPEAGIPVARGWYRQDDFPLNGILYRRFGPAAYRAWLRRMAVRYVVLADTRPDYSSEDEAELLRSGRSGLPVAFRAAHVTIFRVPDARPLVTGPAVAHVLRLQPTRVAFEVDAPGTYRVALRFSPYWIPSIGCIRRGPSGMVLVSVPRPAEVDLRLRVSLARGIQVLTGEGDERVCAG